MKPLLLSSVAIFIHNDGSLFNRHDTMFKKKWFSFSTRLLKHSSYIEKPSKINTGPFGKLNTHNWQKIQFGFTQYIKVMNIGKCNFSIDYNNNKFIPIYIIYHYTTLLHYISI